MEPLTDRVRAALAADPPLSTTALCALLVETGKDRCTRRERITYLLNRFLTQNSPVMSAPSTTHQFKKDFAKQKAIIEADGQTKAVSAANLTDDDVPLLKQYGYGHLIERKTGAPADAVAAEGLAQVGHAADQVLAAVDAKTEASAKKKA